MPKPAELNSSTDHAHMADPFDQLTEVQMMLNEAIAVVHCRLVDLNNTMAYAARDLLRSCAERIQNALKTKSIEGIEDASAPIGVALAVLHVAVDETDNLVIWAAIRLVESAKEKWDAAVSRLPVEA